MKKVYFSFLILFIVLLFASPVILAKPNNNLNVLLYSEDKEDTATHLKLYASDEITPNKSIIYSIVITASVPSPLGQGNVIDQGLMALVVPETAEVDYQNIKVYGAPTPDSNKYVEYQSESELTKKWFNILGSIVSKIPFLGLVMDLAPLYQARPGDYGAFIDLNQYDIVKVNWETPRLKYWQKVQIDIPVHLGDDTEIGLYAYWQSRASSSDGTGPTFARDNMVDIGFNISEKQLEEEVVLRVEKLTWNRTFGGSDDDWVGSLVQTTDGGYVLAGDTESYGSGNGDFWVIKLDSDGKKEWEKIFGGSDNDWGLSIVQTTDGGYALAGCTELFGVGKDDFWVIKLDSDGRKEWEKNSDSSDDIVVNSLVQTTDGGYALAGYNKSYGSTKDDSWVIKLDSDGKKEWEKTFGGIYYDYAESHVQTTDGGYALAGYSEECNGGCDADSWLIKLDSDGKKEWEKTFGGIYYDYAKSLIQTTDGGYALAGYTKSYRLSKDDFWLIKLDSDGKKEWEKTFGGSDDDYANSLIQTTDGGYALAGYTKSYGGGDADSWLIKLDSDGKKEWDKIFGGSDDDVAISLIQTTDGGYALAGITHISYGLGNVDSWVIKLDEQGNLGEILEEESISTGAFDYSEELRAITSVISNFFEAFNNQEWAQAKKYCLIDSEADLNVNEAKDALERDFDSDTKINIGFIISDIDIDNISAKVNYIQKLLMTCKGEIIQEDIDEFEILLENIDNQWKICEINSR